MENKYLNDAIIGGKNITASYTYKGELLRIMYDTPDYKQFVDFFHTGVKINDSGIIYLHEDINNRYNQYYVEDTNILNTEIENTYFNLKVKQTDFVLMKNSVLIKRYVFENNNIIDLDINFLIHSKLLSDFNNMVGAKIEDNMLVQYCHSNTIYMFSKERILSHQLNDTNENITSGKIQDKDYIGMSSDSSISYNIGKLKPGEKKGIDIYIYIKANEKLDKEKTLKEISDIKKMDLAKEQGAVEKYWKKYIKEHMLTSINDEGEYNQKIKKIYKRTILLYPLLMNASTGGISAAVEVDETMSKCGRYAYCWPRDAIFVTKAFDMLNMKKEADKFYKNFCKNTQSKNGMWEQRFYSDGRLAPCWGYQIDETASVIYGVNEHYKETHSIEFLKDTLKMCENATKFLCTYMDNILETHDTSDIVKNEIEATYHTEGRNKLPVSYDIWEMNEGVHLYSLASIYAAFKAMLEIYENIEPAYKENRLKLESINKVKTNITKYIDEIKKYILKNMYDEQRKCLLRNCKDKNSDISVLGAVIPFNLFSGKEKKVQNTVEIINMTLRTYTGGYLRFEYDHYMGGKNPWTIATLWMAMYYKQIGKKEQWKECMKFVINSSNQHGFLAEQIDNNTMKPIWVNGLAWAHAMFVLALGTGPISFFE